MLDRKGFKELVAAFSKLYEWFQDSGLDQCIKRRSQDTRCVAKLKLVLKGADRTANSAATIENFERNGLNGTVFRSLFDTGAIEYIGDQLDSKGVAALIKASDTYASSYKAGRSKFKLLPAWAINEASKSIAFFGRSHFVPSNSPLPMIHLQRDFVSLFWRPWLLVFCSSKIPNKLRTNTKVVPNRFESNEMG